MLVAWDKRSLDALYLSAAGIQTLRAAGFTVRNVANLHAKVLVAGSLAYMGSGNLTNYGLNAGNVELGAYASAREAKQIASAFETWWGTSSSIPEPELAAAIKRQAKIADERQASATDEWQPGARPRVPWPVELPEADPDPDPAPAAAPPAIVHFWRRDTIAANHAREGKPLRSAYSRAPMAGTLPEGTTVYTVGWFPGGGLLLLNRFVVNRVSWRSGEWQISAADSTPLRTHLAITGAEYVRDVRLRGQRSAPRHYMSFSPMAYLSAPTAKAFDRLLAADARGR